MTIWANPPKNWKDIFQMSDIIRLLPDSVANQIAAGEVIQRPASVLKELVENSVDAGATEIEIYIKDAGRTLLQVVDNGKGMSETDARMAFERHATSKIRQADDLFTLRSMGFRGEALPSICAISQVEVRTRTQEAQTGTRLLIEGSRVECQEPCMCERGTSMSVRNLFFNVPARRKFLKSDSVELSNIMREFERLALVNHNIRLKIDTGTRTLDLMAGTFRQRIGDLWKNNLSAQLIPIENDNSLVRISGFVSRPEFARRRNALQYLIVNGRNMRHPYFHKAILSCFDHLIAADTQPCYFIRFEVDPATIDVNIHPTKNEIKFEFEQDIWKLLAGSVRSALGIYSAVPSIDFDSDVVPVTQLPAGQSPEAPDLSFEEGYNPFSVPSSTRGGSPAAFRPDGVSHASHRNPSTSDWQTLYDGFMAAARESAHTSRPDTEQELRAVKGDFTGELSTLPGQMCMQVALKYIVVPVRDGLMVIDQHRAHTLVLFHSFLQKAGKGDQVSIGLLYPETIVLDAGQQASLAGIHDDLRAMGYIINEDDEEPGTFRIVSAPPGQSNGAEARDTVLRILDAITEDSVNYGREALPVGSMTERTALLMARGSAIMRGRRLSGAEMEALVAELFSLPDPALTPDGKRICTLLDSNRLDSLLA